MYLSLYFQEMWLSEEEKRRASVFLNNFWLIVFYWENAGDVIIKEGCVGTKMYFIQEGIVDIVMGNGEVTNKTKQNKQANKQTSKQANKQKSKQANKQTSKKVEDTENPS